MGGESIRAIAASESRSIRRVQQIVRQELERRDANPADDYAFLQMARLEQSLDLLGGQIDAGKPAAVHAFVRVLEQLNRIAPERLRLRSVGIGVAVEIENMTHRLHRLDAAREVVASRTAARGQLANAAQSDGPQAIDNKGNGETADFAPPIISEA
ncbi:MAG TPA: hypothetical protein VGF57_08865 [Roseiarcus sp.]